ncbi:symmetrical bis(5'-nucleosyl)-tetraphosphatase [Thalassomonas actiniarum]|uniref:bis(5'-nucleosyl)-tetraphosphatase (symmetrical) n=1 Tax=Thalassomonas actiniarum TaxID=485447 RepID=A0AAE9YRV8_9GAMM|nr:symmetrical bis(5'-nucleosyl)-tetraphosphatase [Thalassomonas actiniarum]WDD99567.1 symmetrical bis(5'-nucleosyl)-tetraphosphatase [Thalassomonas actiniarum]
MAIYLVGDIQGCLQELKSLLNQADFCPEQDQLYLAGDVVARGPQSLETLRFLISLGESAKMVLGNHDLHLLAIAAGIKTANPKDKLEPILQAPDLQDLIQWLAGQPLLRQLPEEETYISHAGLSPQWSIKDALVQAASASEKLKSSNRDTWLKQMYGNSPDNWHQAKTEVAKFRYTINAFTRMRYCREDLSLEFNCKETPEHAPKDIFPWYQLNKQLDSASWVFGHWASLMGQCPHANLYALDTGCVWGNHLTLVRWHDKQVFTEQSHTHI